MLKQILSRATLVAAVAVLWSLTLAPSNVYALGEKYKLSSDGLTLTGSSGNFETVFGQFDKEVRFTSLGSKGYADNSGMLVFYYEGKPDNLTQQCGSNQGAYVEVHVDTKTKKTTMVKTACGKQSEGGTTSIFSPGSADNIWDQGAAVSYTPSSGNNQPSPPTINISGTPTYQFDQSSKDGSKIKACGGFYKQFGSDCVTFQQISTSGNSSGVQIAGEGDVVLYSYSHSIPGDNQSCTAKLELAIPSAGRSLTESGSLNGWVGYRLHQADGTDVTDRSMATRVGCTLQRPENNGQWERSPGLAITISGADKLESFLDGSVESNEESKPSCGSEVTGIGWIICPVTNAAIGFADTVWVLFEKMLVTNPIQASGGQDNGAYYSSWKTFQNIANVLLFLVFLLVVFSQVSNIGISNYGIKKMLPRLVIVAVLANVSFPLMQMVVDLANIAGRTIIDVILSAAPDVEPGFGRIVEDIIGLTAGGVLTIFGASLVATSGMAAPLILFLAMMLIPAIIGLIAGFIALAIRSALIPVLAVLAPVVMIAYILPNTQPVFDRWRKILSSLILLYPLAAVYFGALKFTASILLSSGGILERIFGNTLLFFGCFVVAGLAIKGNAITGKVYGAVNSSMNKAVAPARKLGMGVAGGMAALNFAKFKNRDFNTRPVRQKLDPRRITDRITTPGARAIQGVVKDFDVRKSRRGMRTKIASSAYEDMINQELAKDANLIPEEFRGTAAARGVLSEMQEKRIANETLLQGEMTVAEIKKIAVDMNASVDARVAAVRRITTDGNASDIMELMKNSGAYGAGSLENQAISKSVFAKGFQSVLGPGIGDKIIRGNINSTSDINNNIIDTINKGLSAESLLVDADLTGRVATILQSEIDSQKADPFRPQRISTEKIVQASEAADLAQTSETLSARLKGDFPEHIQKIKNI